MTEFERLKNLEVPTGPVDMILDTDAFNEIDDQFAISYMLANKERLNVKAITAAPFFTHDNYNSVSAADGMEKSYMEIHKLLKLADRTDIEELVYRGSTEFLPDEHTPVDSPAARRIAELALGYSKEKPLYVVAIGAITNVASAIIMQPEITDRIVIVWLGGHAEWMNDTREFNMLQDVAAARIIFGCGAPLVQLPCGGVVDRFATSEPELRHWLYGKNKLCDYLVDNACAAANSYASGRPWTRVIWDVTAVAWLINDGSRFMSSRIIPSLIPEYDNHYGHDYSRHSMRVVTWINRDRLFEDLFGKLSQM